MWTPSASHATIRVINNICYTELTFKIMWEQNYMLEFQKVKPAEFQKVFLAKNEAGVRNPSLTLWE
jgi:hypothetical protein